MVKKGYKQTEVGVIPEKWKDKKLGDVGKVCMCKRIFANQTSNTGEVPFFKIGTFGKEADAYISKGLYEDYKQRFSYPQKSDVLISAAGTLGRTIVFEGKDAYFQDSNIVWLDTDKELLCNEYLYHYYKVIKWGASEGSTIARLYNGIICNTHIALPDVEEQKQIATVLSELDEHNSSSEYTAFFSNVTKLFEQRLSPVEGMVKYAYHHFRMTARDDLCEKILKAFGESDVQSILDWEKRGMYRKRTFNNFGFSLIFSEGNNIASFEIEYILHCMKNDCQHYWDIFWFLLGNEYSGFKPNIQLAVDMLERCENDELPEKILEFFFADSADKYYSYSNKERRVDNLKEWLDVIKKNNGTLSESLKIIVTILAAYDPTEFALEEYHDFVLNEDFFKQIQKSDLCNPIKLLVSEFKDRMKPQLTDQNALQALMEILKSEGYYE